MQEEGTVCLITPCYNSGKFIHRLLDSVLSQDYPSIYMITVDDGSTDNTKDVIHDYIDKFEKKGYELTYIYQENSGQSVAINNALKLIKGEYLLWPDSDDFYRTPDAISKLVDAINQSDDIGMARCYPIYLNENNLSEIRRKKISQHSEDLFRDCLFGINDYWFLAGGCVTRIKTIKETIPNLEIYTEKNAGQNWQLMLPILYKRRCVTILEYLYCVTERSDSHSRGQFHTYRQQIDKYTSYENTIIGTLERMNELTDEEKTKYIHEIKAKYVNIKLNIAILFRNHNRAKFYAHYLKKNFGANTSLLTKLQVAACRFRFSHKLLNYSIHAYSILKNKITR